MQQSDSHTDPCNRQALNKCLLTAQKTKTINEDSHFVHAEYEQTESLLSKQERTVSSPSPFPCFNGNTL